MKVKAQHPLKEIIAKKLFGISRVPPAEQERMVSRACIAAVEWHKEQTAWISVNEKLPEKSLRYLCVVSEQTDLGKSRFIWNCYYNSEEGVFYDELQNVIVTHWMPLPSLPEGV